MTMVSFFVNKVYPEGHTAVVTCMRASSFLEINLDSLSLSYRYFPTKLQTTASSPLFKGSHIDIATSMLLQTRYRTSDLKAPLSARMSVTIRRVKSPLLRE